jgi:hypothetical protein
MRNQILIAALFTGALGLWAAPAFAQETFADTADAGGAVVPGDPSVQGIALSGRVDFYGVFRDDFFDTLYKRSAGTGNRDESFINARISLSVEVTVMPGLWGVIELETSQDAYAAERRRAGDNNQFAQFRQGFLVLDSAAAGLDRWVGGAQLKAGVMNVRYDIRSRGADGHPFFMDLQRSENPFAGTPNLGVGANGTAGPIPFSSNSYMGGNAWVNNYAGQPKTQEAGGAMLSFFPMDDPDSAVNAAIDVGGFQVFESGMSQSDTSVVFVNTDLRFGDRDDDAKLPGHHNLFNIMLAAISHEDAAIFDYGAGVDLLLGPWVELYAEAHGQVGEIVDFRNAGGARVRNQHEAWAMYGGIRLEARHHNHEGWISKPYLDYSWWVVSGDSGVAGRTNHDFVSFENVHHALIIEGSDVGLDIDSNYVAQKIHVGFTLWEALETDIFVGTFLVHQRPAGSASGSSKVIGNELDIRLSWRPSETFRINLTIGNMTQGDFWRDNGRAGTTAFAVALGATATF